MATQRSFSSSIFKLANIFLVGCGTTSLLAVIYFLYYYSWTVQRQFTSSTGLLLCYGLPTVMAMLFFASLKLKPSYRISICVFYFSLFVTAFAAELYLYHRTVAKGGLSRTEFVELAKQSGVEFDTREVPEIIADLRKDGIEVVPQINLMTFGRRSDGSIESDIAMNGVELEPLAGIAAKVTVVCNQTGKYLIYKSDEHGFHNPSRIWQSAAIDIVAVGNSFTMGYCLPSDQNFVALIRRRYPATLNLGMAGEGPLRILAALTEYAASRRPKLVLWFYSERNSVYELQNEKQSHVLLHYLKNNFKQGLVERQSQVDEAVRGHFERQAAMELNSRPRTKQKTGDAIGKFL